MKYILLSLLLSCNARLVLENQAVVPIIPEPTLTLAALTVNTLTNTTLDISLNYSGDTNDNASVVLYFCSIKVLAGCNPLSGHSVVLAKSGSQYRALIDLSLTTITGADLLKYQIVSSDIDGLTGGDDSGFLIVPHEGVPKMINQLGYITMNRKKDASLNETVLAFKVDSLGRTYLSGYTDGNFGEPNAGSHDAFVIRLTSSGALDTSFSSDGIVQLGSITVGAAASGNQTVNSMALDTSGNIYLSGITTGNFGEVSAGGLDAFVVRLTSTGVLDTSFSGDGIAHLGNVTVGAGASGTQAVNTMSLDAGGNIYVSGHTTGNYGEVSAGSNDAFVVRLTSSGILDTSFSSDGIVHLGNVTVGAGASGSQTVTSMALDTIGNIYLSGHTTGNFGEVSAGGLDAFVVRLTSSGALDTSFSTDGIVHLGNVTVGAGANSTQNLNSMAVDTIGNIYLAGQTDGNFGEVSAGINDAFVVRLTSSGALDTSFSTDGIVHLGNNTVGAAASGSEIVRSMSLDASGNIYLSGSAFASFGEVSNGSEDAFVVRLTSSGALDTSFSTDGIVQLGSVTVGAGANGLDYVTSVTIGSSGNIYLSGSTYGNFGEVGAGNGDAFVVRLTSSGVLDTSFNSDGIVQLGNMTVGGVGAIGDQMVTSMALDTSGNIYLSGYTWGNFGEVSAGDYDAFVVRLTSIGALDTSFGGDGIVQLGNVTVGAGASGSQEVTSMALDTSGNIYLSGYTWGNFGEVSAGGYDAFVVRLTSSGALDTSFSSDGIAHLGNLTVGAGASGDQFVYAMDVDSSGNVYLSGYTFGNFGEASGGIADAFVVRLTSSGALDTSFSSDGIVHLGNVTVGATASSTQIVFSMVLDTIGNIYLSGITGGNFGEAGAGGNDAFVVRLTSSGALDTSFSTDGIVRLGNITIGAGASGNQNVTSMALDSSGNIYLSGHTTGNFGEVSAGGLDAFVVRLTSSGVLDTSFSSDGIAHLGNVTVGAGASNFDYVTSMSLDTSGNIYLAGYTPGNFGEVSAGSSDAFLVRLTPTGVLDTSFNNDGIVHLGNVTVGSAASGSQEVTSMALDTSGNIYLSGYTAGNFGEFSSGNNDAFFILIDPNGDPP